MEGKNIDFMLTLLARGLIGFCIGLCLSGVLYLRLQSGWVLLAVPVTAVLGVILGDRVYQVMLKVTAWLSWYT
jgi:xanthine/uracil/vitamin C permease (AzgA family)